MNTVAKCKCEYIDQENKNVTLRPVYDPDPNSENGRFFKSTPSGQINLNILNPAAFEQFEQGADYYVTFEKANKDGQEAK